MDKNPMVRPYAGKTLSEGWNGFLENDPDTRIDFGLHKLGTNQSHTFQSETHEQALLVIEGRGSLTLEGKRTEFERSSWIEQPPWATHTPHGVPVTIQAETPTEIAVIRTENPDAFPTHLYLPDEVENEHRGQGILEEASYRIVRCVFDRRNAPEAARLVLGEVVNFPGRWSSYPPHHHTQPELYYYRFEPEWGYGHAELGERVFKMRHNDLLKINDVQDHAQTSAPGFHLYYLWTIRHLPENPYTGFEFTEPFETLL